MSLFVNTAKVEEDDLLPLSHPHHMVLVGGAAAGLKFEQLTHAVLLYKKDSHNIKKKCSASIRTNKYKVAQVITKYVNVTPGRHLLTTPSFSTTTTTTTTTTLASPHHHTLTTRDKYYGYASSLGQWCE